MEIPFQKTSFAMPQPCPNLPWTSTNVHLNYLKPWSMSLTMEGSTTTSMLPSKAECAKSHFGASHSPRCMQHLFSWCNNHIANCKMDLDSVSLSLLVHRAVLKHKVGRGSKMMQKLKTTLVHFWLLWIVPMASRKCVISVGNSKFPTFW